LILAAAIGIAVSAVGNLLEDVFDVSFGKTLFTVGGMSGSVATLGAAVLILTARHALRWTGLLLLAFIAGAVFPDDGGQWLSGVSLVLVGWWVLRLKPDSPA